MSDEEHREGSGLAQPPPKSPAFRLQNSSDLFGLGLETSGRKESSEEGSMSTGP